MQETSGLQKLLGIVVNDNAELLAISPEMDKTPMPVGLELVFGCKRGKALRNALGDVFSSGLDSVEQIWKTDTGRLAAVGEEGGIVLL
jgi:hypothetical protein